MCLSTEFRCSKYSDDSFILIILLIIPRYRPRVRTYEQVEDAMDSARAVSSEDMTSRPHKPAVQTIASHIRR